MEFKQWTNSVGQRYRAAGGAWENEPDKIQWLDKTGKPCVILRSEMGHLNGYVAVKQHHPLYRKHYQEIDYDSYPDLHVHYGLTFADPGNQRGHVSGNLALETDRDDLHSLWWFGFDTNHYGDLSPYRAYEHWDMTGIYRDVVFVRDHCRILAEWLTAVEATNEGKL